MHPLVRQTFLNEIEQLEASGLYKEAFMGLGKLLKGLKATAKGAGSAAKGKLSRIRGKGHSLDGGLIGQGQRTTRHFSDAGRQFGAAKQELISNITNAGKAIGGAAQATGKATGKAIGGAAQATGKKVKQVAHQAKRNSEARVLRNQRKVRDANTRGRKAEEARKAKEAEKARKAKEAAEKVEAARKAKEAAEKVEAARKAGLGTTGRLGETLLGQGAATGAKQLAGGAAIAGGAVLGANAMSGFGRDNKGLIIKSANVNVAGKGKSDKQVKATTSTTLKTVDQTPKPKKEQQPIPKLGKFSFRPYFEKDAAILTHAVKVIKGIGKAVGKAVKGGVRSNAAGTAGKLHRGNVGKAMVNNAGLTGAATLGVGAYGTKKIYD